MAKARSRRQDPVVGLMEVGWLVQSSPETALQKMFDLASNPSLPQHWSRGLKALTKQIRRVTACRQRAFAQAARGDFEVALKTIRQGESILKAAPSRLVVEVSGPLGTDPLDMGGWVVRAVTGSLRQARSEILAQESDHAG